jgi:hypothetical protein
MYGLDDPGLYSWKGKINFSSSNTPIVPQIYHSKVREILSLTLK